MIYSTTSWSLDSSPWRKEERSIICYFPYKIALHNFKKKRQKAIMKVKLSCIICSQGLVNPFVQTQFLSSHRQPQHPPGTRLAGRCSWFPGFCAWSRFPGHQDPADPFGKAFHWTAQQGEGLHPFAHSKLLLPKDRNRSSFTTSALCHKGSQQAVQYPQVCSKHTQRSLQLLLDTETVNLMQCIRHFLYLTCTRRPWLSEFQSKKSYFIIQKCKILH